jgi:excinuclease ABC subunit A
MIDMIEIVGAKEHNLKNINVNIPKNKLVVITGLSGSGKSSLAFDTLYAEGRRRYVESLSAYARQFLHMHGKPEVESITGLSPAIAIDQKAASKNPRSTIGTITEIYDYLRLLYARVGIPYSPVTGKLIEKQSASQIIEKIQNLENGTKIYVLSPIVKGGKGEHCKELATFHKQGFKKIKLDNIIYDFDDLPKIDKNKKHSIDLVVAELVINNEPDNNFIENIETALKYGNGTVKIEVLNNKDKNNAVLIFSEKFACHISNFQLDEIEPRNFSFNSPFGACPSCEGLGTKLHFDERLIIPNTKLSLNEGAIAPWKSVNSRFQLDTLKALSRHFKFNLDWPFEKLPENIRDIILYGSGDEEIEIKYIDGIYVKTVTQQFEGIIQNLEKKITDPSLTWTHENLHKFQSMKPCDNCNGYRLKPESLCIKINNKHIGEISKYTIKESLSWFENLPNHLTVAQNNIAEKIIKEVKNRLQFLVNVGLDYLTLARNTGTLSGGENQRIRLASQIGSGLSGVLYVLDEPSIGLHQSDNGKLIQSLIHLSKIGNSVIVVEHDEETMLAADHIVDIGPGAGIKGGYLIAQGSKEQIMQTEQSITGQYLSRKKYIPVPTAFRKGHPGKYLQLKGATLNNLQNVNIDIPLGTFTCVTGVSGSGKSSLLINTLYKAAAQKLGQSSEIIFHYSQMLGVEYLDKIININQSPIGRTPRSNPATYTGVFNPIRDWFAGLPKSKARGYKTSRFSFNVKGGRCETCQGDGLIKIEMHFLPDIYIDCEECGGKRYNKETLEIQYNNKSIADVLNMTVDDAHKFFEEIPTIKEKISALQAVGLGYIKIGQSATTLSGGEAQRVKLAKELSRHSTGKTLYILDEPTTGLHIDDISKLLKVLYRLVEMGNTVIVIEHNLDVIKTADYIIDIGPGGGNKGGKIVATGTPYEVAKNKNSITGKYLKDYLFKVVKATDKVTQEDLCS